MWEICLLTLRIKSYIIFIFLVCFSVLYIQNMEKNTHNTSAILMLLDVESASFNTKKSGKFYVKIFFNGEGPLKSNAVMTRQSNKIKYSNNVKWRTVRWLYIVIDPKERLNSLRFEVFQANNLFPDSLVGVATYKLETKFNNTESRSQEEKSLIPCEHKTKTSLKICKHKASKGVLNIEMILREKVPTNDGAHQDYFVIKWEDFKRRQA